MENGSAGKTVILIRHAKSSWQDLGARDCDRELNARGRRDAPMMGQRVAHYLNRSGLKPDRFLCSSAARAVQTATLMLPELDIDPAAVQWRDSLYLASAATMLETIRALPERARCVALLAHNPGMTTLAERLSGRMIGNMPTCAVIVVRFDCSSWHEISQPGALQLFDYPKRMT